MKICILAVAAANLDDAFITVEGVNRDLKDIACFCEKIQPVTNVAGDATFDIYVEIGMKVQACGTAAGANTMRVLEDGTPEYVSNIQAANVAQFKKGRAYALRFIDGPLTNMIPTPTSFPVPLSTGVANGVWSPTRYLFQAPQDMNPIGATSVAVITADINWDIRRQMKQEKRMRRKNEALNVMAGNLSSGQTQLLTMRRL